MRKIASILCITLLVACVEDVDVLTSGEIAGNELRTQADRLQIQTAWIYEWSIHGSGFSQYSKVNEGSFSISGQFLRLNNTLGTDYYNLDKLQYFSFDHDRVRIYFK